MHADWQLTGSEPSGIEYVLQHKHRHNFAGVFIPLYCTVVWIVSVARPYTYSLALQAIGVHHPFLDQLQDYIQSMVLWTKGIHRVLLFLGCSGLLYDFLRYRCWFVLLLYGRSIGGFWRLVAGSLLLILAVG